MDLFDFFPSTTSRRVKDYFRRIGWNRLAAGILTRLCTHESGLPQGAPTSPRLSNLVNDRVNLPRETRRWLRAVEHRARLAKQPLAFLEHSGKRPTLTASQRAGWRALEAMIAQQRESC